MDLTVLWGKTDPQQPDTFHPALYHMLDAGFVARALLADEAPTRWRRVLGATLGLSDSQVERAVPLLVALHDIGKCSESFQRQSLGQVERLRGLGVPFSRRPLSMPHPVVSAAAVAENSSATLWPEGLLRAIIDIVGSHHGFWLPSDSVPLTRKRLHLAEPPYYAEARTKVLALLQETLGSDITWSEPADLSAAVMALSGFTILCDWLASDSSRFPPSGHIPLDQYLDLAPNRARAAATTAGLLTPTLSIAPTSFADLYANLEARPLQRAVDAIPTDLLAAPVLIVIEAPTGEGKTEAALALAHRIGAQRGCDAFYYALPTMATSNQMHGRVNEYLIRRLGLSQGSRLVHGQAHLLEDDLPVKPLANGDGDEPSGALDWFAPRKKALLAPFGVGTIDQAELAVLNVRHVALRCAGLAGKTLILDEVHAYDTYMTTIVVRLLAWLHAMGTSVILLSATLPQARLRALAGAWGVDIQASGQAAPAYPRISVFGQGRSHVETPSAFQPNRQVHVGWLDFPEEDAEGKAHWLLDQLGDEGCGCWITNTVSQAQELYQAIRLLAPPELPVELIHARFPLAQREVLEKAVMMHYGPDSAGCRRGIVIGTQVLEQSLDLDFDLMVSDLAPIDLLLQRAGRLHRHDRPSRPIAQPVLHINLAREPDGSPQWGVNAVLYEEYILRRTVLALADRQVLDLPGDLTPLVEAVYSENPPDAADLLPSWQVMRKNMSCAAGEAKLRLVPEPLALESFSSAIAGLRFQENENSARWGVAQTRLGAESITLIPLERKGHWATVPYTDERIDLRHELDRPGALRLLRQSLSVSHKRVLYAFEQKGGNEAETYPKALQHPLLKHAQPLWLSGGQVELQAGSLTLSLDRELGLVITSHEKGGDV